MGELLSSRLDRASANLRFRFGAVLEEFEVRDAMNGVFCTKPELNMAF